MVKVTIEADAEYPVWVGCQTCPPHGTASILFLQEVVRPGERRSFYCDPEHEFSVRKMKESEAWIIT